MGGGGGGCCCCWIAEWCGSEDRAKRRALAPNPRSIDASSWSCPHDKGHGRSVSSLLRRSRHHNDTYRSFSGSPTDSGLHQCFIIQPHHPALPKRLKNVLEKQHIGCKRPAATNDIAGRTAMSNNFIYGDITR